MAVRISDIVIWVLFIASIIVFIWYVFGNSPSFEQMILIFILTILFTSSIKLTNIAMKLNFLEKRFTKLGDSFIKLSGDFKEHIKHK